MQQRAYLLSQLIGLSADIDGLNRELSKYPFDSEQALVILTQKQLELIIGKVLGDEIDFSLLISWANAIECRDDISFENSLVKESIFELANAEINQISNKKDLLKYITD